MVKDELLQKLKETARAMVVPGKGVLAADESLPSIEKKFTRAGVPLSEENRRAYREMLFTAPAIEEYISGIIMFDETIRFATADGRPFINVLKNSGILAGIKVDQGVKFMENSPKESTTKGLESLPSRLPEYVSMGATFSKWRAVVTMIDEGLPTEESLRQNAKELAAYARMCQEVGLVPIVEPEVVMDGSHPIEGCRDTTERALVAVFEELKNEGVAIEGMLLKPNMILPGKDFPTKATPEEVAETTLSLFKKVLPEELPGIIFLSGGQKEIEATENLNAMNKVGGVPWPLSFSFGRALQTSALKAWDGKPENVSAGQKAFIHRAKMNSLATLGKYKGES